MIRFTLSVLLTTLISGAAFADGCTSVETATVENFNTCSKVIKDTIYKAAPAFTAGEAQGKTLRAISTRENDYKIHTTVYADYRNETPVFSSIGFPNDSSVENGFYALYHHLLRAGGDSGYTIQQGHSWKGAVLSPDWSDQYYYVYVTIYPMAASALLSVIQSDATEAYLKVDALAAYLPLISSPSERVLFLMDFLRKPEISASKEVGVLAKTLAELNDSRSVRVFNELLQDARVTDSERAKIVKAALSAGITDSTFLSLLASLVNNHVCNSASATAAMNGMNQANADFQSAVSGFISACGGRFDAWVSYYPSSAQASGGWIESMSSAVKASIRLKNKTSLLPIVDFLTAQSTTTGFNEKNVNQWSEEFRDLFLNSLRFLGAARSPRALPVLYSTAYYNSPRNDLAKASRDAVENIQVGVQLDTLKKGDLTSLQWAMDMITYHDGAKRAVQLEILNAFEKAMKVNPTAKARIKAYLKKENAEGYHDYDAELSARMKAVAAL